MSENLNRLRVYLPGLLAFCVLLCPFVWAQPAPSTSQPPAPAASKDSLGRTTPRGTVMNFLAAARKEDYDTAARYLNTRKRAQSAAELARQLFVVLDHGLPAELNRLSDRPEGSLSYPADPELDLVGKIKNDMGDVDILVERIDRGTAGSIWLFSKGTLQAVPELYDQITEVVPEAVLPGFLVNLRIAHVALFEWLAVFLGLPLVYLATGLLNSLLSALAGAIRRRLRRKKDLRNPECLPGPIRLLLLALIIRVVLSGVTLPLLERQFWANAAIMITIGGCVWLALRINGVLENYLRGRLGRRSLTGVVSILRFTRRFADVLVLCAGFLVTLHSFGVNVAAALAGLGVGGIAVALAAQKTLENVIGGVSLVFDQVVHVGERLKVGETEGAVEEIGLRSTRIRTLDRTVVSLPNGQLANAILENTSSRDQYWFHHILSLGYDTSAAQLRTVIAGIRDLLGKQSEVIRDSVRVSFLRFGKSSLDIEMFVYLRARDMNHFFAIQEGLLLLTMELVEAAGARVAIPMQSLQITSGSARPLADLPARLAGAR